MEQVSTVGNNEKDKKNYPTDYIICMDRFPRLVVACMNHCPYDKYCFQFYKFFRKREISPVDYYNEDGLGAKVMRRVVFDCDRCEKKDIAKFYSRYTVEGVSEEYLRPREEMDSISEIFGYPHDPIGRAVEQIQMIMEESQSWVHMCEKCYQKLVEDVAKQFKIKSKLTPKKIKQLEQKSVVNLNSKKKRPKVTKPRKKSAAKTG